MIEQDKFKLDRSYNLEHTINTLINKVNHLTEEVARLSNSKDPEVNNDFYVPKKQTEEEWRKFAHMWVDGIELEFFDLGEGADNEWFDVPFDDFYAYDELVVYRQKYKSNSEDIND